MSNRRIQKGDLVEIIIQPSNQIANLVGIVAMVDSQDVDGLISITAYDEHGEIMGIGRVPPTCLKVVRYGSK